MGFSRLVFGSGDGFFVGRGVADANKTGEAGVATGKGVVPPSARVGVWASGVASIRGGAATVAEFPRLKLGAFSAESQDLLP